MKIDHIAIWTQQLDKMRQFYEHYFNGKAGEKYLNPRKNFESYFIEFEGGCRLELMEKLDLHSRMQEDHADFLGITHFALAAGNREKVDELTEKLRMDGHQIVSDPRTTGDGYYESIVLDPDGNRVEIMA